MILFGSGKLSASPGERDEAYVKDAKNLKQARERYHEQFGMNVDDRKIEAEIEKCYDRDENPLPNREIPLPSHLVLAILLRKGAAGSMRGAKRTPVGAALFNTRDLIYAQCRIDGGEKKDDVVRDVAKNSSLSEVAIRDRLTRPGQYGIKDIGRALAKNDESLEMLQKTRRCRKLQLGID
jgi:hypothetical protein